MSVATAAAASARAPSPPRVASSPALSPTPASHSSPAATAWDDARSLAFSPASAAIALSAKAAAAVASSPSDCTVLGSLRIRVVQVTDLPVHAAADASASSLSSLSASWLRYSGRRQSHGARSKADGAAANGMICMLLTCSGRSSVLATTTAPSASAIVWNEEFYVDDVSTSDEFTFFCVDRTKNAPYAKLPLREDIAACPGFIGKVAVPLARLPEGEEIEQWYPLVPKETYLSLRTALRIALCFTPSGETPRVRVDSTTQLSLPPQRLGFAAGDASAGPTERSLASPATAPTKLRIQIPASPLQSPVSISLKTGIVDYVIVVGAVHEDVRSSSCSSRESTGAASPTAAHDNALLFRFPATDRPHFPLPTKIEWFCFPGGPDVVVQARRPQSKLFSFVLVGGDDGLSRTYAVCLTVYHRAPKRDDPGGRVPERPGSASSADATDGHTWHGTCVAFLTRVPLIDDLSTCLLAVAHAWLASCVERHSSSASRSSPASAQSPEALLVDVCHRVVIPIRGVFGVRFTVAATPITLVLPTTVSIYSSSSASRSSVASRPPSAKRLSLTGKLSPTKLSPSTTTFTSIQHGFEPLVYSLAPLFALFEIKTVVHLVALVLCEYRVLLHSTQFALLSPIAEALCALIYPFRWQHPYVPILPRVLAEYLQAPLPYVLGVHTSWLRELLESGRPEHLVVVDIDRGTLQLQDATGPMLPSRLTKGLHQRLKRILHPSAFAASDGGVDDDDDDDDERRDAESETESRRRCPARHWTASVEQQVRIEFVCYLAAMVMGYRDCLFFVNQKLPVFNKRRYLATCASDSEVIPFVTKLFCTQAFQGFLETHSSADLSVFHSVYLTLTRTKDLAWPLAMPQLSIAGATRSSGTCESIGVATPVFAMPAVRSSGDAVAPAPDAMACAASAATVSPRASSDDDPSARSVRDASSLGAAIEALLDQLGPDETEPFALDAKVLDALERSDGTCDYKQVAQSIGVDARVFEDHAEVFRDPHDVNQRHGLRHMASSSVSSSAALGASGAAARTLSSDDERTEQVLHKCLTSVFASDDMITAEDIRLCELRFKQQYARDLFVLILMQPSHQYVEMNSASSAATATGASTWYNPKGAGNCIGASGFQILARLASALMDQCAVHEDFTNARGMLQVAFQYYHFVEDKHSGIGFAKKEYLVTPLRLRPVCRSLDMWQHACTRELEAAVQADPTAVDEHSASAVADELFFSVIGSLVYDMLTVDVPVPKVHAFVSVMCSTYQKGRELLDTLKQLVENVYRALELSNDAAAKHPSTPIGRAVAPSPLPLSAPVASPSAIDGTGASTVASSRSYDLDTVIRRKMSTNDAPLPPRSPLSRSLQSAAAGGRVGAGHTGSTDGSVASTASRRRAASTSLPSTLLSNLNAPVLSLAVHQGRVACGLADASISVVETTNVDKRVKLEGHTDAVVAVQLRGSTLISGSRDHTLRVWDLRATPKRRQLLSFFASAVSTQRQSLTESPPEVDSACVSKKSLVWRGHTGAVTCLEMGRQLSTDRSLIGSGSDDGSVRLWDTTREHSVAVLGSSNAVRCLRFLAHYDYLVSGGRDHALKVWDLAESKLRTHIQAHRGAVLDIQITGDRLVTASNDRVVKVWDAHFRGGQTYVHALRGHGGPVQCVSLGGPADPNICTGSSDGIVRVWDLRYVERGPRLALAGHAGLVTCLRRDFTKLVSGSEDGSLRVWDMHSGVCLKDARAHLSGVTSVVLRDSLVYSSSWDGSVRLWDIDGTSTSQQQRV